MEKQEGKLKAAVLYRVPGQAIQGIIGEAVPWSIDTPGEGFLFADAGIHPQPFLIQGSPWDGACLEYAIPHFIEVKNDYKAMVENSKDYIIKGNIKKVVLSDRQSGLGIKNPEIAFSRLCETYPNCLVVWLQHEKWGNWMGASPELLLKGKGNSWESVSLAGTRMNEIFFEKERKEQAWVTKHISDVLECFAIPFQVQQEEVKMGRAHHLSTRFQLNIHKQKVLPLLEALHPTPAVVGYPVKKAWDYIVSNEKHLRMLYTGYWGIWKGCRDFDIYVNIRCVLFDAMISYFFGGAGITSDSNPEFENQEIQLKIGLIKEVISAI